MNSKSRMALPTWIVFAQLLLSTTVLAQVKRLVVHKDTKQGFELQVPDDWDQVPLQPDEDDILARWARDTMSRGTGDVWQLEVMRFRPASGTTPGAGETPVSTEPEGPETIKPSPEDFMKAWREANRPKSFADYYGKYYNGAEKLPAPLKGKFKMAGGDASVFAVARYAYREHGAIVGVVNDGTFEWAVVYTAPAAKVMKEKKGQWVLENDTLISTLLKSIKSFKVIDADRSATSDAAPDQMSEVDRKIWEVKKKLPEGWTVIPTPSQKYVVVHNIPQNKTSLITFANNIVKYLDRVRDRYEETFPPQKPITAVSVVKVCQDREEYMQYGAPGGSAGYWSPRHEELVIYDASKEGGKADSYATLFHEAFHQYIYYAVGEISPHSWYNEGYGDYFAGIDPKRDFKVDKFDWRTGVVRDAVSEKKNVHLKDLIRFSQRQYYANPDICYAQGWALIYFLNSSAVGRNELWGQILKRYFDKLVETGERDQAVDFAYAGIDLDELNTAYEDFVRRGFK